jgi:gluconokinase
VPEAIVVMGVAGSGKTTVGRRVARRLRFDFEDADAYHSAANVAKMAAGLPLTDADRAPWLVALRRLIEERSAAGRSLVLACSALKRSYRKVLAGETAALGVASTAPGEHGADAVRAGAASGPRVTFVYLRGDYETILARLRRRRGHYMHANMLQSQFRDLQEPDDAVTVDATGSVPTAIRQTLAALTARGVTPAPR